MFERIRPKYNVWKDKVRILMFGSIRSELQCLEGYGRNSNVWKNRAKIPMFGRPRPEFQCLKRKDKKLNV